ncbi:MAG: phosphonate C-P lyase system protein PhnG [Burkholderiaceae bacterium]|nr:phosphonate C-P lyase system protein PhnG [Burkholderiaceae bacterium]
MDSTSAPLQSSAQLSNAQTERAVWMSLLAQTPFPNFQILVQSYGALPHATWLREPEIGLAMVRARTGGTGSQFNLGEITVTRCTLKLSTGEIGHAYLAGRNKKHAEWAALFDALMQTDEAASVREKVLVPITALLAKQKKEIQAQAEATKVDFLTMVRGEN